MSIREQAKKIRNMTEVLRSASKAEEYKGLSLVLNQAADTIESLSAKLADMERLDKCHETEKRLIEEMAEEIENLYGRGTDLTEWARDYLAERPAEDCGGGWIYCGDGKNLPEDGVDVLVWFEYFRYGEYNRLFQTKGISFTHNGKWSGFVNGQSGWNQLSIIAWQPMPEKYQE